eukprot:3487820-Prorocentrum_lima.AAC.1
MPVTLVSSSWTTYGNKATRAEPAGGGGPGGGEGSGVGGAPPGPDTPSTGSISTSLAATSS